MLESDDSNDQVSSLRADVDKFLKQSEFSKLIEYCFDKENCDTISENGWDLLTQMMNYLKNEKVKNEDLKIFEDLFKHIAANASYKEMFLGLLEQFDPMVQLDIVRLLFPALKTCSLLILGRDKSNQCQNLSMLFCTLTYYVDSLNLPKYATYMPEDKKEETEELTVALYISLCVDLEHELYSEIIQPSFKDDDVEDLRSLNKLKREFICFSCTLLERLSHLDLDEKKESAISNNSVCKTCHNEIKSNEQSRVSECDRKSVQAAYELCAFVRKIEDPFQLYRIVHWSRFNTNRSESGSEEENDRFEISRAVYVYLNLLKEHEMPFFPQILHPVYVFICSIPSILVLWKTANSVHVHKGLELARFVTNRIGQKTLRCDFMNQCFLLKEVPDAAQKLLSSAINIAMQCPTLLLRQRAIQFVKKFLDKFDWPDRYSLLLHLLMMSQHPGVVGYLIGFFKDKLNELLEVEVFDGSQKFFMQRSRLHRVFDICFNLPDGSDSDLLAEYDKIMASLNLLRFLLIRDSKDRTSICGKLDTLQRDYLNPLRSAINLSRMHFRDELKQQSKPKHTVDRSQPTLMINGISLSSLSLQDRKQALQSAVNSFDVLQSICIRVQELMDKCQVIENAS